MKKLLLFILAIVFMFSMLSCGEGEEANGGSSSFVTEEQDKPQEAKPAFEIELDQNAGQGLLSGKLTALIECEKYELYFGDDKGALEGYTKIGEGTKEFTLNNVVVPPSASHIVLVAGEETYSEKIPEECVLLGNDAFIFGALSDIHFNKYYSTEGQDDAVIAFDRALDYFDKIGVEMVGITGDLSNDGEESALINYNDAIKDREYPVFTVVGNHDMPAFKNGLWKEHISNNIQGCEEGPNMFGDYIYKPQAEGDEVFIFLNLNKWSYSDKVATVLYNRQLDWLETKLEEYKDSQVYLFFHLFLCGPDGQKHTGVGNIMNPGGYTYPLPFNYANYDERRFRRLMTEYKNVVYFSGHSHWMFEMEIYGEQANFSNFNGDFCYMVHVPSVTEPRWIGENDTDRTGKNGLSSQGWIIYDYGETTVLVPIDFVTGTIYTEYMEIIKE